MSFSLYACFTFLISNSHSLKLEETAKGVRISVHVYTNDKETAINKAIATYLESKQKCKYQQYIR
jgi:hypothetical protein